MSDIKTDRSGRFISGEELDQQAKTGDTAKEPPMQTEDDKEPAALTQETQSAEQEESKDESGNRRGRHNRRSS